MNAHELVAALGERIGIATLALDGAGRAALDTSEGLHVELQSSGEGTMLNMTAVVGVPRAHDCADLMADFLKANTAASGVCLPGFAFSQETREVLLTVSFPVRSLPVEAAQDTLLQLVERAAIERARLGGAELQVA